MATPISGKDGAVKIGMNSVGAVTGWTLKKSAKLDEYASSEVPGYTKIVTGVKSASGTVDFKLDSEAASTITEGTAATLDLIVNDDIKYSVPAVIESFDVTVDINDGNAVKVSASWKSNGSWTEPTFS
jgi:hypothetical protein